MLFLLNMFKGFSFKHLFYIIGAAVLAAFVYFAAVFIDDKYEAELRIDQLEQKVEDREESIRVLKEAAEQKDRAIKTANAVITQLRAADGVYEEIRRDTATVKEEDNGPVAPVLRRTLNSLSRLQ